MVANATAAALSPLASRHLPLARLARLHRHVCGTLFRLPELEPLFRPEIERDQLASLLVVGHRSLTTSEAPVDPSCPRTMHLRLHLPRHHLPTSERAGRWRAEHRHGSAVSFALTNSSHQLFKFQSAVRGFSCWTNACADDRCSRYSTAPFTFSHMNESSLRRLSTFVTPAAHAGRTSPMAGQAEAGRLPERGDRAPPMWTGSEARRP